MNRYLTTGMYASHKGNPITFRFEVIADDITAASEVVANRVMSRKTYAGKLSFDLVQAKEG